MMELQTWAGQAHYPRDIIAAKMAEIHAKMLRVSPLIRAGNFEAIAADDLRRLFAHYDRQFFEGRCRRALYNTPLTFRLSKQMTRSAGTTTRKVRCRRGLPHTSYEIAISAYLLFHTFRGEERTIRVSGIVCYDRLQALQRVFEHELIHLVEMLAWGDSACSGQRFQALAFKFFRHTDHRHELITPFERAVVQYGIRPGDRVAFQIDGVWHAGIVNRITKRATVLVENPRGQLFDDGRRYLKFYVPLRMLVPQPQPHLGQS